MKSEITIATHNGSKVARAHNLRNPKVVSKEDHIQANGDHETWIDIPLSQAYEELFGDAVKEYNERQTRDERKIGNYLANVKNDAKKHPVYEMIVGVYVQHGYVEAEEKKTILKQFVEDWIKTNPNFVVVGCYYHNDEEGKDPHIHIDYVPVAHGYKKGMETQVGLVKALEEMGYTMQGKQTAIELWTRKQNQHLEDICGEHGLQVLHPQRDANAEHLKTAEYKAVQKVMEELHNEVFLLCEEIRECSPPKYKERTTLFNGKQIVMSADEFEKVNNARVERQRLLDQLREAEHKATEFANKQAKEIERLRTSESESKEIADREMERANKYRRMLEEIKQAIIDIGAYDNVKNQITANRTRAEVRQVERIEELEAEQETAEEYEQE